jgi:hypothetical protein
MREGEGKEGYVNACEKERGRKHVNVCKKERGRACECM